MDEKILSSVSSEGEIKMSMQPKISIITVSYNAQDSIEQTIQSVLSQTYPFFEYIIVDGSSMDQTIAIINKYKQKISQVISEKDLGIYDAMNKGLQCSTGDIICFLNADDKFYDTHVLETVVLELNNHPEVELFYGKLFFLNIPENLDFSPESYNRERKTKLDAIINAMPHQATFTKRSVFKKVGAFNLKYKIGADYDWFLRCYKAGVKMRFVDRFLSFFSYDGMSYKKRYVHIPERIRLVSANSSFYEFFLYSITALIRFLKGVFLEYVIYPLKKFCFKRNHS